VFVWDVRRLKPVQELDRDRIAEEKGGKLSRRLEEFTNSDFVHGVTG
jgi:hypothetical protein